MRAKLDDKMNHTTKRDDEDKWDDEDEDGG